MSQSDLRQRKIQEAHDFVLRYMVQFNKPIPLHILNRRLGVKFKQAVGVSLKTALEADDRFIFALMENGSTSVAVEAGF